MKIISILKKLNKDVIIFDGAMGTMLQNSGLKLGELPEEINIEHPEIIIDIHKKYIKAGSDVITTNTFGANERKLYKSKYSVEDIIIKAIRNAKIAKKNEDVFIALGLGSIGELLEPLGTLKFEDAYNIYKRQVLIGLKEGVDLILIETLTDLYEAKAAILAVKENSDLPVFCTMSFEENQRTFTGCSPISMVMVLEGLGVDALGINCSLGPKEIAPLVDLLLKNTKIPIMVQPNAGLPIVVDGETKFNISKEEFSKYAYDFVKKGVNIIGGCCGTDDEYISLLSKRLKGVKFNRKYSKGLSGVCTPSNPIILDRIRVVGERINPTGKEDFKEYLLREDVDILVKEAIIQEENGADILDVNVGLPEINESKIMVKTIKEIQSILDIPLQIDSNNIETLEKSLRIYNGKAIVNSVTGESKSMEKIFPIVKKYGASVIGLTIDENGIPEKAEDRYKIAKKIIETGKIYGIDKNDIYIDCLTLTAATNQEGVLETLKAVSLVKNKLDVKTTLGVSNISFGFPNRSLINGTFLSLALKSGLDLPIIDPLDTDVMDILRGYKLLSSEDKNGSNFIDYYRDENINYKKKDINYNLDIEKVIIQGRKNQVEDSIKTLLEEEKDPMDIINNYIIPSLDLVGDMYEKEEIFLPQLVQSAETVKVAFNILKKSFVESEINKSNGKIILATVEGDIHDIGKNIVKVLLENYNYDVIDLGKDVPKEVILENIIKYDIRLVGLSALMTTTVKSMESTIELIKNENPNIKVMVGGAVLTKEYANKIGADYYAKDAKGSVEIAKKFFNNN